jgi:hypothetical protein
VMNVNILIQAHAVTVLVGDVGSSPQNHTFLAHTSKILFNDITLLVQLQASPRMLALN